MKILTFNWNFNLFLKYGICIHFHSWFHGTSTWLLILMSSWIQIDIHFQHSFEMVNLWNSESVLTDENYPSLKQVSTSSQWNEVLSLLQHNIFEVLTNIAENFRKSHSIFVHFSRLKYLKLLKPNIWKEFDEFLLLAGSSFGLISLCKYWAMVDVVSNISIGMLF